MLLEKISPEKNFLLLLCFLAFLFWKNQPLLDCFYASLKKFSEKIRFCFFDSTLLKKFSLKKSPSASSLLRFLAPLERITLCFIASSLLRFLRKTILEKNQPLLLCFYASWLSSSGKIVLCFYASCKKSPKNITLCFFASLLLRFFPGK